MKVLFSTIAMFLTLFAFGAEGASAQCDQATKEKLYKEFLDNRRATTVEGLQTAVNSGKRYVELCKNNPGDEEIVAFITRLLPRLEKALATEIRFTKFEQAAKNLNHAEAYKLGREILAEEPADSELRGDFSIYLTWAGYKAMDSVDAYTTLGAIALGRETIALINNGAKIVDWGLFDGNFKQDKDGDSKSHTLGWLNFAIAEMLIKVDNKPEAMAHYYETTRFAAPIGSNPVLYQTIGAWYLSDAIRVRAEGVKIYEANGDQDTEESTRLFNLAKGYAERAIDSYNRAYMKAKGEGNQALTASLYNRLGELYKFRFDGKEEGLDAFLSEIGTKNFPDPRTPVEPIVDEEGEN